MRTKRALAVLILASLVVTGDLGDPHPNVAKAASGRRPNILIIVTDDQPIRTLKVMPRTRHWLVKRGTRFQRAFAATPLCCPSRATIMTGQYAHNTGVKTNADGAKLPVHRTVQHHLHKSGYSTGLVGKWLNAWPFRAPPNDFDTWAVLKPSDGISRYWNATFNLNGRVRKLDGYATNRIASLSTNMLRTWETKDDAKPWFLMVSTGAPHLAAYPDSSDVRADIPRWRPSPAVLEKDRSDKPPWVRAQRKSLDAARAIRQGQLRTLISVDRMMARLRRQLRDGREARDTLVIYLSDNGYLWRDHGVLHKRYPYSNSIRIPFLARWPGRLASGATVRRYISTVDVAPTVFQAAGVTPSHVVDGQSLLETSSRKYVFNEFFRDVSSRFVPSWASLKDSHSQYIEYFGSDRRVMFREYYDLTSDPFQLRNLLQDGNPNNNPDLFRIKSRLEAARNCAGRACP